MGNYQLCWSCKKACGGCSWSKDGEPIKDWTADKNVIPLNGKYAETYKISKCPEYVKDREV